MLTEKPNKYLYITYSAGKANQTKQDSKKITSSISTDAFMNLRNIVIDTKPLLWKKIVSVTFKEY